MYFAGVVWRGGSGGLVEVDATGKKPRVLRFAQDDSAEREYDRERVSHGAGKDETIGVEVRVAEMRRLG